MRHLDPRSRSPALLLAGAAAGIAGGRRSCVGQHRAARCCRCTSSRPMPGAGLHLDARATGRGTGGYYWVPGTWVLAPAPGLLWTPGYWGWGDGAYLWHAGYWGPHVGFYGGINYGFGYGGVGFQGGDWRGNEFYYNRSVNNVHNVHVTNVYNRTVVNNVTINRTSFNGGKGGVMARPDAAELARGARASRRADQPAARARSDGARATTPLRASVNGGQPGDRGHPRPAAFSGTRRRGRARRRQRRDRGGNRPPRQNHATAPRRCAGDAPQQPPGADSDGVHAPQTVGGPAQTTAGARRVPAAAPCTPAPRAVHAGVCSGEQAARAQTARRRHPGGADCRTAQPPSRSAAAAQAGRQLSGAGEHASASRRRAAAMHARPVRADGQPGGRAELRRQRSSQRGRRAATRRGGDRQGGLRSAPPHSGATARAAARRRCRRLPAGTPSEACCRYATPPRSRPPASWRLRFLAQHRCDHRILGAVREKYRRRLVRGVRSASSRAPSSR